MPSEHRSFHVSGEEGGPGVLLLHGGSGSPADLRELAEDLAAAGFHALCPRLPAHGRGDAALGELDFDKLIACALEAFDALTSRGKPVAIVGQSMGATLAIRVAVEREPIGLVALAPALRPYVARRILRLLLLALLRPRGARITLRWQTEVRRGMRAAAARVGELRCPLLILHSEDDDSVDPRGARELLERSGSKEKRLEMLQGQGHVLSTALDRGSVVFPRVREFLANVTAAARSGSPDPVRGGG